MCWPDQTVWGKPWHLGQLEDQKLHSLSLNLGDVDQSTRGEATVSWPWCTNLWLEGTRCWLNMMVYTRVPFIPKIYEFLGTGPGSHQYFLKPFRVSNIQSGLRTQKIVKSKFNYYPFPFFLFYKSFGSWWSGKNIFRNMRRLFEEIYTPYTHMYTHTNLS